MDGQTAKTPGYRLGGTINLDSGEERLEESDDGSDSGVPRAEKLSLLCIPRLLWILDASTGTVDGIYCPEEWYEPAKKSVETGEVSSSPALHLQKALRIRVSAVI